MVTLVGFFTLKYHPSDLTGNEGETEIKI